MAQREYEMMFQLNAKLGSQYSSTLRSAQSELTRFRDEYRELSRTVNDVAAYQRQQNAVDNTKSKLELLQTQYDNIQREMDETGGFSSDLANKLAAKRAQIEKTQKAYEEQVRKLEEYKRALEAAGVDTSGLDKELERLRGELRRTKEGFDEGKKGAEDFGNEGKDAVEELGAALAAVGITKLLKEIYEAFAECVKIAADFEAAMSDVEAISGASGEEIAALTERAKELGATTAFTAQQVGEGMSYMAMAGWKTTDMLAGMDSVLALASASGEDLSTTSDIVTDALTAFGLTAKDTGRFADILATASSNANTNVALMGETFKYAAPVAGALGYSVEDVAVAIGLMANSGIKASQAGTTLKNIFNGLLGGVDLTGKAFGEVNVTFENTDGTMMDLASSINVLRGYFEQMTEAERVHNAINIAGQRGYSGLLAILNSTTEDYNKLTDAINNSSGAAQRMADIKLDNLNGQMTIAKSAAEGLKIAIGDQFTPALTKMYQIFASILSGVTDFVKRYPTIAKAITALTIGVAAFVAGLTVYIAVTKIAKAATMALTAAMESNPYLLLGAAIAGVVVALASFVATTANAEEEVEELTATTKAHNEELSELRREYEQAKREFGESSDEARDLQRQIYELEAAYGDGAKTLSEYRDEIQRVVDNHDTLNKKYSDATTELTDEYNSTLALIEKLEVLGSDSQMAARNQALIVPVIEELNKRYGDLGLTFDALTGRFNMTTNEIREVAAATYDAQKAEQDWQEYVEKSGAAKTELETLNDARAELTLLTEAYNKANDAVSEYKSQPFWWLAYTGGDTTLDQLNFVRNQAREAMEAQQAEVDRLNEKHGETVARLNEIETEYGWAGDAAEASGNMFITYSDAVNTALAGIQDEVNDLAAAYDEAYKSARDSIDKQLKLFEKIELEVPESTAAMTEAMSSQIQFLTSYTENLRLAAQYGISDGLIAALSDGSVESAQYLQAIINQIDSLGDDTEGIRNFVNTFNTQFSQVEEAKNTWASTVADMQTDFSSEMDKIESRMTRAIEDLSMEAEAAAAATDTMTAYTQAIRSGAFGPGGAVAAATAAGNAVQRALRGAQTSSDQSGQGYASGTDYASPGWHMVGEEGPEMLLFNGGEKVLSTDDTAEYLRAIRSDGAEGVATSSASSGTRYHVSFSPTYNLSGAADSEEVRTILAEHDAELVRQVREMLEEEEEDRVRRRM